MSDQEVDHRDRRMDSIKAAEEMNAAHANSVLSNVKAGRELGECEQDPLKFSVFRVS